MQRRQRSKPASKKAASRVRLLPEARSGILQRLSEQGVLLPNKKEVTAYLGGHARLARLLPGICSEIRKALGDEVELSLEKYKDPEIDDCYLTLYARQGKYEFDILDRLQAINDRLSQRLEAIPGYFLLATDFSPPRGCNGV